MPPSLTTPKFEVALDDLEKIVAEMEDGALPLEQLVERYEEGMRLVKLCQEKLSEAEQKIEVLTRSSSVLIAADAADAVSEAEKEADDGAKLF